MSEMQETYRIMQERYPLYPNPFLVAGKDVREVLIGCVCGAGYRIMLNGTVPIPPIPPELDVSCKNCGVSIHAASSYSGHSAGIFNAIAGRMR